MRSFVALFGLQPDQDVRRTAIAAVKNGYAVVPVAAEGKMPLCTYNARQKKAEPAHPCGVYHALNDETEAGKVFQRLLKAGPVNLGIVAAPSNLLIVDCDTAEQVQAFVDDWASHDGEDVRVYGPTSKSPGMFDEKTDTWLHRDGGHFIFDAPEGWARPDGEVVKFEGGYDVKYGWSQALVAPSRRKEGPYLAQSDVMDAPTWLLDAITAKAQAKVERRLSRAALTAHDGIAAWSVSTSWADLLLPHGWTETGKLDKCGCPIFTRPGGGSTSFKSATAHEADCLTYENLEGHGPLHLWTTEPPEELMEYVLAGQQTLTKLTFVAAMDHDGDISDAMVALGLEEEVDLSEWLSEPETVTTVTEEPSASSEPSDSDPDDPDDTEIPTSETPSGLDPTPFMEAAMAKFGHPESRAAKVKKALGEALDKRVANDAADEYVKALMGASVDNLLDLIDAFAEVDFEALEEIVPTVLRRSDGQVPVPRWPHQLDHRSAWLGQDLAVDLHPRPDPRTGRLSHLLRLRGQPPVVLRARGAGGYRPGDTASRGPLRLRP